jgi:hypothetical protein
MTSRVMLMAIRSWCRSQMPDFPQRAAAWQVAWWNFAVMDRRA